MSESDKRFNTIVVGGGAAGLIAARDLHESGKSVVLFEAQDRLGGRIYSRPFKNSNKVIDLGGTYFNYHIMKPLLNEIDRYNLSYYEVPAPNKQYWKLGDKTIESALPDYTEHEWNAHIRLCDELEELTKRVDITKTVTDQPLDDLDYSLQQWLEKLKLPKKVFETFKANYKMLTGCNLDEVSLLQIVVLGKLIGEVDFLKSEELKHNFTSGAQTLIEAIVKDAKYEIKTNTVVNSIRQNENDVEIETTDGNLYYAENIVITVPFNTLKHINFSPPLPSGVNSAIQQKNPCRSLKFFATTEGVNDTFDVTGTSGSVLWASSVSKYKKQQIITFFGNEGEGLSFNKESVEKGLVNYLPELCVSEIDGHNWNKDQWSLGGWMTWRPGWLTGDLGKFIKKPFGRVIFAGSDYTEYWTGWIAGAIASGQEVLNKVK